MNRLIDTARHLGARFGRARFERQVQALLPDLYRAARGMAEQPADAEDLVHDTCVKAFAAFQRADLRDEAACRAWLHRILLNTFRDRYRRAARSPVRPAGSAGTGGANGANGGWNGGSSGGWNGDNVIELAPSREPSTEERAHHQGFAEAARAALGSLPPDLREVAVLFLINGLPYKDIAAVMDCPIGTVMSRLSRARRLLRERLARFQPAPGAGTPGRTGARSEP